MDAGERTGHCDAEDPEVRCRGFGTFLLLLNLLVVLHRVVVFTHARAPYRDKSFAGGFYGTEMKPALANRDFPINSILDPPQHRPAISCRLSPWVFLVFI